MDEKEKEETVLSYAFIMKYKPVEDIPVLFKICGYLLKEIEEVVKKGGEGMRGRKLGSAFLGVLEHNGFIIIFFSFPFFGLCLFLSENMSIIETTEIARKVKLMREEVEKKMKKIIREEDKESGPLWILKFILSNLLWVEWAITYVAQSRADFFLRIINLPLCDMLFSVVDDDSSSLPHDVFNADAILLSIIQSSI
jgi:hypothetical protein